MGRTHRGIGGGNDRHPMRPVGWIKLVVHELKFQEMINVSLLLGSILGPVKDLPLFVLKAQAGAKTCKTDLENSKEGIIEGTSPLIHDYKETADNGAGNSIRVELTYSSYEH